MTDDGRDVGLPEAAEEREVAAMSGLVDVVAVACLLAGAFLCLTAGIGLVRFPDVLSRMHAGTKPQVLGVLLVMVGGAIRLQGWRRPGCCCWSRRSSCSPRRSART